MDASLPVRPVFCMQHHRESRRGEPGQAEKHHRRHEADPHAHGSEVRRENKCQICFDQVQRFC